MSNNESPATPIPPATLDYASKNAKIPPPSMTPKVLKLMKRAGLFALFLLAFSVFITFSASDWMYEGKRFVILRGWVVVLAAIAGPASWLILAILNCMLLHYRRWVKGILLLILLVPMAFFILVMIVGLGGYVEVLGQFKATDGKTYYSIERQPLFDKQYGLGTDKISFGYADSYRIVKKDDMYDSSTTTYTKYNITMKHGEVIQGDDGQVYAFFNDHLLVYKPPRK